MSFGQMLDGPETIVYDSTDNCYFVSNIFGHVVKIDELGNYSYFFTNCTSPYGMTIVDRVLYVNCNQGSEGGVVGIDIETEQEVFHVLNSGWYHPPNSPSVLNGLTADKSGYLYTAYTAAGVIMKIDIATSTYDILTSGVALPNAVYYDDRYNRLLVTSDVWWTPVYQVDLGTLSITPATTTTGQFSGIAEDAMHNYYISFFNYSYIYRFDDAFSNPVQIVTNISGPEGICFDNFHSQLCIPVLLSDRVDFVPMEVDAWCSGGTSYGWAPLEVQFTGESIFNITEWHWDFGDGSTSDEQSPLHVYEIPGLYYVELEVVTETEDIIRHVFPRKVYNLADTIWADDIDIAIEDPDAGYEFDVTVYAKNSVPLYRFQIPVEYSGDLALTYNSYSVTGCRSEEFEVVSADVDAEDKRILFELRPQEIGLKYIAPGSGPVLKLRFTANGVIGIETAIDVDGYLPSTTPRFYGHNYDFSPAVNNGLVRNLASCGDVDSDGKIDLLDIVYLIDHKFKGEQAPLYMIASDVNRDGFVDILDIVYLIDHKFKGGPGPCDE
jgi:hypothetical protein